MVVINIMNKDIRDLGTLRIPLASHLTEGSDEFWHTHGFVEIFIITFGEIDNIFADEKRHLRVGDCCLIVPGEAHTFQRLGPCSHRDYMIRPDLFGKAAKALSPDLYDSLISKKHEYLKIDLQDILFLERKTSEFFNTSDVAKQKQMEFVIAIYLLSLFYVGQADEEENDSFKERCLFLVSDSYIYPDACKRIKNQLNYNEKYFCKKFKKSFGMTLVDYVNAKRMGYAHYLLLTTPDSVESICAQTGITSLSYFHKIYYKTYHKTPAKSRTEKLNMPY